MGSGPLEVNALALAGRVPGWALSGSGYGDGYGYGYGDGYGYGYGYGYGDGSGYGYGSGSGYGYGSGDGDGDGDGYGDGYGSGSGDGYGSGDGSGDGYGDGYGYGYGDGYGDGYGYGSGSGYGSGDGSGDIERSRPLAARVRSSHLTDRNACSSAVRRFARTFPNGATFPADIPKAVAAGLDLQWARSNLGLLLPLNEDVPSALVAE